VDAVASSLNTPRQRFFQFSAVLLVYLLGVILFGAWVRITGSGAGCGDHWPTCHGQIMPRSPNTATIIEYSHRLTSGLLGLGSLLLPIWAWRVFPARHPGRVASLCTLGFVLLEAGIGAGLVLRQLVASNASVARAVAVALHLGNTLLLTGSAAVTVAWAHAPSRPLAPRRPRPRAEAFALGGLLLSLVLVAASGAVTALGDTLFPVHAADGSLLPPAEHFLVQLRVVHPVLACGVVSLAILSAYHFARTPSTRPWALALGGCATLQLVAGAINIALNAPGWLQLIHLLGAQLSWISAVLLTWTWRQAREI
jgi:cytochrome c oxidase assembly protein subunit 15